MPGGYLQQNRLAGPAIFEVHLGRILQNREFLRADGTLRKVLTNQDPTLGFIFPSQDGIYKYWNVLAAFAAIQLDLHCMGDTTDQSRDVSSCHAVATFRFVTSGLEILLNLHILT